MGCGSGILAIAALKLGAKRAIGIDIDPKAITASMENAERNQVQDKLEVYLPEDAPEFDCDVIVANILAAPLKRAKKRNLWIRPSRYIVSTFRCPCRTGRRCVKRVSSFS